jgi:hypothetical protein
MAEILKIVFPIQGGEGGGADGEDGEDGLDINWRGAWQTATAYAINDAVKQNGSSYICIEAHTSGTFGTDLSASKWDLMAEKGDQGDPGADGADGADGTNGTNGTNGTDGEDGASLNPRGDWATSTAYAINDVVNEDSVTYICQEAHTSGTFSTDLAADKWMILYGVEGGGSGSETLGTATASTVSDDAITYTKDKRWAVDGDAAIDFTLKVDHTTIPDGGTMKINYKANGANRTVSFATVYTTKLGTSMTVASGDTAHFKIERDGSVYHLSLTDVT